MNTTQGEHLEEKLAGIKSTPVNNLLTESIFASEKRRKEISRELTEETIDENYSPPGKQGEAFSENKEEFFEAFANNAHRILYDLHITPILSGDIDSVLRKSGWNYLGSHLFGVSNQLSKFDVRQETLGAGLSHDEPEEKCERSPNKGIFKGFFGYKKRDIRIARASIEEIRNAWLEYERINPLFSTDLLVDDVTRVTRFEEQDYLMDTSSIVEIDPKKLKIDFGKIINPAYAILSYFGAIQLKEGDRLENIRTTFSNLLNFVFNDKLNIPMNALTHTLPYTKYEIGYSPSNGHTLEGLINQKKHVLGKIDNVLADKGYQGLDAYLETQKHLTPAFLVEKIKRNIELLSLFNSTFEELSDEILESYSDEVTTTKRLREKLVQDSLFNTKKIIEFYLLHPEVDLRYANGLFVDAKVFKHWDSHGYRHFTHPSSTNRFHGFFEKNLQVINRDKINNLSKIELLEYFIHLYHSLEEFKEDSRFYFPEMTIRRQKGTGGYSPIAARGIEVDDGTFR
ncbi:hypothetical protein GOV05_04185 [Candidatus Woesearchaeota archaeon]|nr:hypothetical protein [Candidatus Woesearchaeota archaeon]